MKSHIKHTSNRWFKSLNVSIASEGKQRKLAKDLLGVAPKAEKGAFTFVVDKKEEVREVPFVYYPNFIASSTNLTWHDGAIPADEIWVKLGGDKGRGSFKFNIQLLNTKHPNSIKNTVLLSVFKAGDTATNLHTALVFICRLEFSTGCGHFWKMSA